MSKLRYHYIKCSLHKHGTNPKSHLKNVCLFNLPPLLDVHTLFLFSFFLLYIMCWWSLIHHQHLCSATQLPYRTVHKRSRQNFPILLTTHSSLAISFMPILPFIVPLFHPRTEVVLTLNVFHSTSLTLWGSYWMSVETKIPKEFNFVDFMRCFSAS